MDLTNGEYALNNNTINGEAGPKKLTTNVTVMSQVTADVFLVVSYVIIYQIIISIYN